MAPMRITTSPLPNFLELAPPPVPTHDRRANIRYPLVLGLKYAVARGKVVSRGQGFTVNLSRNGVLFESAEPLSVGLTVELCVAWPVPLNGVTGLNFWAQGRTVRMHGQLTAVQILNYEFRLRGRPRHEHSERPQMKAEKSARVHGS